MPWFVAGFALMAVLTAATDSHWSYVKFEYKLN